jgi:hypothetical protein
LRGDARGPMSFHPRLTRALAEASSASWCRGARSIRLGGHRGIYTGCGGNRSWPGRPPRVKLDTVGDAHEVAIPCGLKVQAPNRISNHHRDGWWKAYLQRAVPYLVCQLSVRKLVPTLISKSAEIYLSMAGAKQLGDTMFILVPSWAVRPAGVCSRHCIALHRGAC